MNISTYAIMRVSKAQKTLSTGTQILSSGAYFITNEGSDGDYNMRWYDTSGQIPGDEILTFHNRPTAMVYLKDIQNVAGEDFQIVKLRVWVEPIVGGL